MQDEESFHEIPRIHVVDDDESFRNSVVRFLRLNGFESKGYACVGEFLLADALDHPGCILLDIAMPGPSGIDMLKALRARRSGPPIVFVTGRNDIGTSVDVMKSGAIDYIVKPASAERILAGVRKALERDARDRAAQDEVLKLHSRFDQLTAVERSIFRGIAANRLNKQLAGEIGACERTIKAQRASIRRKLKIRSVPEFIRAAKLLEDDAEREGDSSLSSR